MGNAKVLVYGLAVAAICAGTSGSFQTDDPRPAAQAPKLPYEPAPAIAAYLKGQAGAGGSEKLTAESVPGAWLARELAARRVQAGIPVAFQCFFYPSVDIARTDYPSYDQYGVGYSLDKEFVETARRFYVPDVHDWTNADASPLRTPDQALAASPPALPFVSDCAMLRDEGLACSEKLRRCGAPVTCLLKKDLTHG
jgi:hypothetical protein